MPFSLTFENVSVVGDAEVAMPGSKDLRITSATSSPRVFGINGGTDGLVIAVHNVSGVAVPLLHNSGSAGAANRKLLMNGLGGNWTLPHGRIVRAILIDPNDGAFPDAARGWYVDNRGQEVFGQGRATATTSAPTNAGALAVVPEMSVTIATLGGPVLVSAQATLDVRDGDAGSAALYVDGAQIASTLSDVAFAGGVGALDPNASGTQDLSFLDLVVGLAAGSHTFELKWARTAGTLRAIGLERGLHARELPA